MQRQLRNASTVFLFFFHLSCSPTPISPLQTTLLIYRFNPPAFIEYSVDFQPINEIPFTLPPNCGLNNTFTAPVGKFLVIELNCPNGQTALFLNSESGAATQPVTGSDSHFLAWANDGKAAYLKFDSLGNPRILQVFPDGRQNIIAVTRSAYDLSPEPGGFDFTFSSSSGLGSGSGLYLARDDGRITRMLYADKYNYLSFVRWSPDGRAIAFIKIPDTEIPFTVGELWIMDADGSNAHKVAGADAGHGFAANWSPDGKRIAFVLRENPDDQQADQSSDALVSNIYLVDIESGALTQVTHLTKGRAETPFWSPDGNTLAFNIVVNGRMEVQIADVTTGEIQSLISELACCPTWMRK